MTKPTDLEPGDEDLSLPASKPRPLLPPREYIYSVLMARSAEIKKEMEDGK